LHPKSLLRKLRSGADTSEIAKLIGVSEASVVAAIHMAREEEYREANPNRSDLSRLSVNRLWRANKGGGVHKSAKYTSWTKHAEWAIAQQVSGNRIVGRYGLSVRFVRPDKRRRDLDNLFKAVSDALVHTGVIESDHLCERINAAWVASGPECEVILEQLNDDQQLKDEPGPV